MATLNFKGKAFVQNYHLTVKHHELVPCKAKSLTKDVSLNDNLIVHGDNLKALKALLPTYAGKVKCIYIDPPYNTGNEHWCYNDAVNSPMHQEWFEKVVDREDLTRHDKWLCMMLPRLKLLRELLRDDGVIFISIDDNEVHHLRMLMDEVFGEDRFIGQIIWKCRKSEDARALTGLSTDHEYLLCFCRVEGTRLRGVEKDLEKFSNPDNDPRGPWRSADLTGLATKEARPNLHYNLVDPKSKKAFACPEKGWRFDRQTMAKKIAEGRILFPSDGSGRPRHKLFQNEMKSLFKSLTSVIGDIVTGDGTRELDTFMGTGVFGFPKPKDLILLLIKQVTEEEDVVLDSFAGSGTTAHSVLALNAEDGGNRKFILIECEDYADNVTAERVRRVIQGVPGAKDEALKKGLGGSFSYFELGKPVEVARLFKPKELPTYKELAKYVFFTATGAEFDAKKVNEKSWFIGETADAEYYLIYKPDIAYLKRDAALTLDRAKDLGKPGKKRRVIFAPSKYVDEESLDRLKISYAQLPFEVYKLAEG